MSSQEQKRQLHRLRLRRWRARRKAAKEGRPLPGEGGGPPAQDRGGLYDVCVWNGERWLRVTGPVGIAEALAAARRLGEARFAVEVAMLGGPTSEAARARTVDITEGE